MSYIHNYEHQLCGTLGHVPLYYFPKPLPPEGDFEAGPSNLVLGGGSGEHPEAVYRILTLVETFLLDEILQERVRGDDPYFREFEPEGFEALVCDFLKASGSTPAAETPPWSGDTWYAFINNAKIQVSPWAHPYDPSEHGNIENWIEVSLGEYALVTMTDLVLSLLHDDSLESDLRKLAEALSASPLFSNVVSYPAGYERLAGSHGDLRGGNVRH